MGDIIKLDSIQDYNEVLGVETLHPLVNVVNMSELDVIRHGRKNFGFYCIILKQIDCGPLLYGRNQYDYKDGTLVFVAPGQIAGANDNGETRNPHGWILMFHPDLLRGTALDRQMKDYTFFSYGANEALHMSERERHIIINCFKEIREELEHAIDKHSKQIVAANIEVLLNHCVRFYDRQFITREIVNRDLLSRFENLLGSYFNSDKPQQLGLPSVAWCAAELHLSANYFGDLIKKETGKSAQEYIQLATVERVKELLTQGKQSISEIAYILGFKYPHHLSRLFKKVAGVTPNEYRSVS
ncbi:AraC family transcriptional regulator [Parabacteroides sp. AM08-6]|uniref:helix-turn-helix domain-containing protein n=1 Tax=Parabacteroides sp. AM08-6 TaxID=2292053 RepID=UPI000EFDD8A4|nr:helix-turn-helix domain-containing protein [Parabacteroides sp. AM08-6]RHJ82682.1 AraC family transcriptional regulator [Parabacteroides sp. AM08-6]